MFPEVWLLTRSVSKHIILFGLVHLIFLTAYALPQFRQNMPRKTQKSDEPHGLARPSPCVIKIASINCETLSDDIKLGTTVEAIRRLGHDVTLCQEARRPSSGILEIEKSKTEIWKKRKQRTLTI